MVRSWLCAESRKRRRRGHLCSHLRREEPCCWRNPEKLQGVGVGVGVGGTLRAEARCEGLCKPVKDSNFPLKAKGSFVLKTFKPKVCVCVCVLEREREKRFQFYKDLLGV